MRRVCILSLSVLAIAAAGSSDLAAAAVPSPTIVVLSASLDLGDVVPAGEIDLVPPLPRTTPIQILVQSSSAWSLIATLESEQPGSDVARFIATDRIEMRPPGRTWQTLQPSLAASVIAGTETAESGDTIVLELRVSSTLDAPPGARRLRLSFAILGQLESRSIPLSYSIPVVTRLADDVQPFTSPVLNPARSGIYPYETRTYVVNSNVAWVAEVTLNSPAMAKNQTTVLPDHALVVLDPNGAVRPLTPNQPLVIATGEATGQRARSFPFQLAVRVDEGVLVGGDYRTQLIVNVRPATAATADVVRSR